MKKFRLFFISFLVAGVVLYNRKVPLLKFQEITKDKEWKTYSKSTNNQISSHKTSEDELLKAKIKLAKRSIAQTDTKTENDEKYKANPFYKFRDERVLIGDIKNKNYENNDTELRMINSIKNNWKELLADNLLRFQNSDTEVFIKEEFPVIKVSDDKGIYLESVIIKFKNKDGDISSFKALVDSENGNVIESWDHVISEKLTLKKERIPIPTTNSGIIGR